VLRPAAGFVGFAVAVVVVVVAVVVVVVVAVAAVVGAASGGSAGVVAEIVVAGSNVQRTLGLDQLVRDFWIEPLVAFLSGQPQLRGRHPAHKRHSPRHHKQDSS